MLKVKLPLCPFFHVQLYDGKIKSINVAGYTCEVDVVRTKHHTTTATAVSVTTATA